MQDLTTGPITRHLLKTTGFMLVTMLFQTLYFLIDLYWVGRLGTAAVAAVGIAGNLTFIVLALTQMLGVGTTAVISHAVGRKDAPQAVLLFNQAQVLAMVTGALFLVLGLVTRLPYSRGMAADAPTAELAAQYLAWFVPAMALQFGLVAMSAALRAIGNFKTGMVVGTATVILNMILAPFLIFGWGTGRPLGVAGAAISSLVAIVVGLVWLTAFFRRSAPSCVSIQVPGDPDPPSGSACSASGCRAAWNSGLRRCIWPWSTRSPGPSAPRRRPDSASACASFRRASCPSSRWRSPSLPWPVRTSARASPSV